eukprot:TRINITY_DN10221_c0_g1_i1.p1 TRINITY_DN10221_c0_g1~~TRINITY_DN10221_c0_g1_i1.p1  ORF type:complete len:542 (+),score=103.56 TRINITY_DN10221_c0_g1_i1:86-1627(+)
MSEPADDIAVTTPMIAAVRQPIDGMLQVGGKQGHVSLNSHSLNYSTGKTTRAIPLSDIAGALPKSSVSFEVYSLLDTTSCGGAARKPQKTLFTCTNADECEYWVGQIRRAAAGLPADAPVPARRLLVFINPFSGTKIAKKIFTTCQPYLEAAGCVLTVIETQRAGHAEQYASEFPLDSFDGIVSCSGDGLVHEVLNGLMKRADWKQAMRIPMGHIPGGTGNGLIKSAGANSPIEAAMIIAKGRTRHFDILGFEQPGAPKNVRRYGFLHFNWAITADVDRESEKYRGLGAARLTVAALARILALRTYTGTLSVLMADQASREKCPRLGACRHCKGTEQQQAVSAASVSAAGAASDVATANSAAAETTADDIDVQTTATPHALPPTVFDFEVGKAPPDWKVTKGFFQAFVASNVTHIAADTNIAPYAHWSDGCLDLVIVQKTGRGRLMSLFGQIEKGEHADEPEVVYQKIRALELIPDPFSPSFAGFLNVDGETLDTIHPIRVECLQGLWTIFTL